MPPGLYLYLIAAIIRRKSYTNLVHWECGAQRRSGFVNVAPLNILWCPIRISGLSGERLCRSKTAGAVALALGHHDLCGVGG